MKNRRQFLTTLTRGALFASLTLLTGVLLRRRDAQAGCSLDAGCDRCYMADRCRLPEADEYRIEQAKRPKIRATDGDTGK